MTDSGCPSAVHGRILRETFEPELLTPASAFASPGANSRVVEVGPRMSFSTAISSNAVSICSSCGLDKVTRVEVSRRFLLNGASALSDEQAAAFAALVRAHLAVAFQSCPVGLAPR